MRVRVKGVNTVRKRLADGTIRVYHYHRATGSPLEGKPGSPEFLAGIAAAEALARDRHAGQLASLLRAYLGSIEFETGLAATTQREYRRILGKVEGEFGDLPIAALADSRVRGDFLAWRETVARDSGHREADNRLSVLSAVLTWATDTARIPANHLAGFKRLYHADRADRVWLPEHVEAFMGVAPVELQRALILALHTGQRQGDLLRLTWANYDGAAITLRQSKAKRKGVVGRPVVIPATAALRRMLDGMDRRGLVILTTKTGRPWSKRYFAKLWADAALAAGLSDLHFHDLRGTAVTMLAEAGATVPEIAAITGHSLRSVTNILEVYLSRTRALAEQAIFRFENARGTDFANRLQTGSAQAAKEGAK